MSNGNTNYYSGTVTATFIEYDNEKCRWKIKEGFEYREQLMEFLGNGVPKLLKSDDGRCWLIKIVDSVTESENNHPNNVSTTLSWVEVGGVESSNDLYYSGLIDVNIEGS